MINYFRVEFDNGDVLTELHPAQAIEKCSDYEGKYSIYLDHYSNTFVLQKSEAVYKDISNITISTIFKIFRKHRGYTSKQMDELLELTRNGYVKYECERNDVKLSRLLKIAKILDIDLSLLNNLK